MATRTSQSVTASAGTISADWNCSNTIRLSSCFYSFIDSNTWTQRDAERSGPCHETINAFIIPFRNTRLRVDLREQIRRPPKRWNRTVLIIIISGSFFSDRPIFGASSHNCPQVVCRSWYGSFKATRELC